MVFKWREYIRERLDVTDRGGSRILAMEGLRGFAASLVFLQHFSVQWLLFNPSPGITQAIANELRKYGNLGVDLFFVLSGFLIYGALVKRRQAVLPFMRRRFRRIYPTFLVVFVITASLHEALGTGKIPPGLLGAATYLSANLLLLPGLWPITPLMSVAWSLSYEMFFYVTCACAVSALQLNRYSGRTRVAIIVILAIALTCWYAVYGTAGAISDNEPHGFHVPIRMLPFFAGMLLAEAEAVKFRSAPGWLALIAPFMAFLVDATTRLPTIPSEWMHTTAFLILCSACFRGDNLAASVFSWTPLRWIGNMSYSFYLFHGLVLLSGFALISRLIPIASSAAVFWLTMPLLYAAAAVASFGLFAAIERPYSLAPVRFAPSPSHKLLDTAA